MNTNESNESSGWLLTAVSCGGLLVIGAAWLVTPAGANGAAVTSARQVTILADQVTSAVVSTEPSKPAKGTGNFTGIVTLGGAALDLKPKVKKGDLTAKDAAVCAMDDVPDESLVVDKSTKGIANVFVYLDKAPAGKKYDTPKEPAVFDQKGCRFLPHGLIARVNQPVLVKSQDNIAHNTHTNPIRNTGFNQAIKPVESIGIKLLYDKPERLPVKVVCDLHTWMTAYHLVLDHPFGAMTNAKGEFEIKDLPPGKYEFIIWQESIGYVDRKFAVEITADKVTDKKIAVPAAKFAK
ncbi:MAG: hypothetical protein HZA46_11920 [Planctomycetales bacterium]|nr:hypothetical protein [Planctomycetales bacterium]